jgi:hypothetical protein
MTPNFRYERLEKRQKNAVLWYDFQLKNADDTHTTRPHDSFVERLCET